MAGAFASFRGGLAIVTGGGDGMGRAMCTALAAEGCSVALCDVNDANMRATLAACDAVKTGAATVTTYHADVSQEAQVLEFARGVSRDHAHKGRKVALFNNAGVGLTASFASLEPEDRDKWERCFNVNWYGVYYSCRAFMPMLLESSAGYIVNTSSVNGFFASIGFLRPHTPYCAAKFAVKGFTEALINDLKLNAPHVRAAVVCPGHIGTGIAQNSAAGAGLAEPDVRTLAAQRANAGKARQAVLRLQEAGDPDYTALKRSGALPMYMTDLSRLSDDKLRRQNAMMGKMFRAAARTSADQAAERILSGVRRGEWRILVGDDAVHLDKMVRAHPEEVYEPDFMTKHFKSPPPKNTAKL